MSNSPQNLNNSVEEIDLLDYLNVIVKRRRMIVQNALCVGLFVALLTFLLPKTYTATTTLLPPDEGEQSGLKSLLSNSPASMLNIPGVPASSSELFVEILKSRTVAKGVIKRKYKYKDQEQNLYEIWELKSTEKAIKKLFDKTKISSNEQGIIQISVEMREAQLAALAANAFTSELDKVNKEKSFSKAKNSRIYIEEQLNKTASSLKNASKVLAEFQAEFKAVDLKEQTKIAIEKAGEIKGTIMAREVEFAVALQTMKRDNPIIERLQKELDELRKQFEHLQFGNSVSVEDNKDYFIPFADVPEVGLRLAELIRDVKVQETVWELLNQQYYSAKIQEARDTPTVQVLDEAVPPEKRTKPKRKLLVLVATFLTFIVSIFWAFVLEYAEKIKHEEGQHQKVNQIVSEVKKDYKEFKRLFEKYLKRSKK